MIAVGTVKLEVWFWDAGEAEKPAEDSIMRVGRTFRSVTGARYAVWKLRWTGSTWRRFRRVTGPLKKPEAEARILDMMSKETADGT